MSGRQLHLWTGVGVLSQCWKLCEAHVGGQWATGGCVQHTALRPVGAMSFLKSASPVTSLDLSDKVLLLPFKPTCEISLKESSVQCHLICLESSHPQCPGEDGGLRTHSGYPTKNVWEMAGLFCFQISRFGWSRETAEFGYKVAIIVGETFFFLF